MSYEFDYVKRNKMVFFKEEKFNRNILETVKSVNYCHPELEEERTIYSAKTDSHLASISTHIKNIFTKKYPRGNHNVHGMVEQGVILTNLRILIKTFDHFGDGDGDEYYVIEKIPYDDIADIQGDELIFRVFLKSGKVIESPWPIDGRSIAHKAYSLLKYKELRNE